MVDEITLREEIKQWRNDNLHYGNKTPLERRAERILKEVLRNMEKGTEKDLATEEEQEEIINFILNKAPKYNFNEIKKQLSKQKDILEDGNYKTNSVEKYSNQI